MGKSNRIRATRAARNVTSLDAKPQKKGMPSWLMTVIALVITLAILLSVAGLLLVSNGVFNRWTTVLSTEHFTVDVNMLSFYFQTEYQNFLNTNSSQLSFYSLDPSLSLKEQRFGGPETTEPGTYYYDSMLGDFVGQTWFDYFMSKTVNSVSNLLIYCEGAYEMGITLTEEDQLQVDANLTALLTSMPTYYASSDAYISDMYGEGVKEKDIRKAMEYSALATKYMTELSANLSEEIGDEDVDDAYAADPLSFLLVDYSYYTFSVTYAEAKKEAKLGDVADSELTEEQKQQISDKYAELLAKVKEDAKAFKETTSLADINKYILTTSAKKAVDEAWSQQTIAIPEKDKDDNPTGTSEAAVKDAVIQEIVTELLADKTSAEDLSESEPAFKPLSESVLGQIETVKSSAFSEVLSDKGVYIREKANYNENDEVMKWAFADTTKVGAIKEVVDGDATAKVDSKSSYSISVYYLGKTSYLDMEKTKNVAYMLFTDEEAAKAVVQAMMDKEISTLEEFEALVEEYQPEANTSLEDYVKGSLQSSVFDEWLYDDTLEVGSFTKLPLPLEDGSTFCVALYYGEGHEMWYVSVKNHILTERFDAEVAELTERVTVNVKDNALKRVNA